MTFERTTDLGLVRRILTLPSCYRRMANDTAPSPEVFRIWLSDQVEYILAREGGRPAALFLLVQPAPEVHFCFLPWKWGHALPVARAFLKWTWVNTSYRRLVGPVPAYNRLALKLAKDAGFTRFGAEPLAVRKHGKSYDRILLELKRP
jgi:RimJ/RimL family protein N-acetyltransferase